MLSRTHWQIATPSAAATHTACSVGVRRIWTLIVAGSDERGLRPAPGREPPRVGFLFGLREDVMQEVPEE